MKKIFYSLCLTVLSLLPGQVLAQAQTAFSFGELGIVAGETKELVVNLDNPDMQVWMMQFDLALPAGLSVSQDANGRLVASKTDRAPGHLLTVNKSGDVYRVVLYTADIYPVSGNSGALIKLSVSAASDFKSGTITASNIKVTNPANDKFSLANATLTIKEHIAVQVIVNNVSRVYGEANPELTYTVQPASTDLTGKVTLACDATSLSGVGEYTITATAASTADMTITCVNGKLTVTPAPLKVAVADATRAYGQDNPSFALSYTGFVGDDTEAVLTEQPSITTEATKTSPIGTYAIAVAGGKAANYTLVEYAGATLTVTKAQLTASAVDVQRAYGEENPALTLAYSGFANGDSEAVLTTVPTLSTEAVAASNVGTYPITVSAGEAENYEVVTYDGVLTVIKAQLLVTAQSVTRMYGEDNPELTVTCSGFVGDDTESVLTSLPYAVTQATAGSSVGTYSIDIVGGEAQNYEITPVAGMLEVTPAPLKVTVANAERAYGDYDPFYQFTYDGLVNGDGEWAVSQAPNVLSDANVLSPVGEYDIMPYGGIATNYYFSEYVGAKLTVTKAPLLVTANDVSRHVGEQNPLLTVSYTGFVNDEDESVLTAKPVATTTATDDSEVGTYTITVSGAEAENYEIAYVNGTLTVLPPKEVIVEDNASYIVEDDNSVTFAGTGSTATAEETYAVPATVEHNGNTYQVTAIADEAFKDNATLVSVTIPETVEAIGAEAFAGCAALTTIMSYAVAPIPLNSQSAFAGVNLKNVVLYVPDESVESYKATEGWNEFGDIQPISALGISSARTGDGQLGDVYTLQGRQVRSAATSLKGLPKGVYIVGGRKVMHNK